MGSTRQRAVVLLSGGLDSAVSFAIARAEGFDCRAISFDYGQRHRHELAAARRVAESLGVLPDRHRVIAIDLRAIGGSALTSEIAVPKDRPQGAMSSGGVPVTYVPARNMVFLSCAVGYAETMDAWDVFIGVNAVDYSGYPDCREAFIRAFEQAANLGTKAGIAGGGRRFRVHTPLIAMTKSQIITRGTELGVDFSLTHSCYDPVERGREGGGRVLACGRCDSCLIRAKGFRDAGVADPTVYA